MTMTFIVVLAVLLGLSSLLLECTSQNVPVVDTPLGKVEGYYRTTYTGKTFSAFEGVPYAQPPTGDLRFKEPQPIQPWEDTLNATQARECLQWGGEDGVYGEDCLYIYIWSPTEAPSPTDNFDVIVYIHGGAFISGEGGDIQPTLLIDNGYLMVSINYRIGVLGFLCTMDEAMSCNNGLKDQSLALKWIQENIASFGGNPDSVTITGISAGGASVHYHYLSPLSKGLFHRGYSISGTALDPWAFQRTPLNNTRRIAANVGCTDTSTTALVECLRAAPAWDVVNSLWVLYGYSGFPLGPVGPSLEPEGDGVFLPDKPYKLMAAGKVNEVPWLTSSTPDEGLSFVNDMYNDLDNLNENWDEFIHYILDTQYTVSEEDKPNVAHKIKDFYFGDGPITPVELYSLQKLYGDREFLDGLQRSSLVQGSNSNSSVYAFMCDFVGDYTCTDNYDTDIKGVCHGEDAQYIFYPVYEPSTKSKAMSDIYMNMLTTFVKTGKPDVKGINWTPVTDPNIFTYLYFLGPDDISLRKTRDLGELEFWESLPIKEYEHEE